MTDGPDATIRRARRVCFFAHYHPHGVVTDAVLFYLDALARAGFAVVVLSTADLPDDERSKLEQAATCVVMRANRGLDFGGWQEAVARFFPIQADLLLLANDSVYGPLSDLDGFIDRLIAVPADVYGAVEDFQFGPHLQSWFLLLRPGAYESQAFADLMAAPIPADMPKWDIIVQYEIGLSMALTRAGLRCHAAYSPARQGRIAGEVGFNPSQVLWRELIVGAGVPFLKIELLRDLPLAGGSVRGWRRQLAELPPGLRAAIASDLARRRRRGRPGWMIRGRRLARPSGVVQLVYWSVMRGFLKRDFADGAVDIAGQRRNAAVFRGLRRATRRIRRRMAGLLG